MELEKLKDWLASELAAEMKQPPLKDEIADPRSSS